MKIDVYSHIFPERYLAALKDKVTPFEFREAKCGANCNIDIRLRLLDRYPDVVQVLTVSLPPLETLVKAGDAVELAKIANDEMAELVYRYPDKFIAAVACLPLSDMDAALEEADRAITQLDLKGVQIFTNIGGEGLCLPKFRPLYEKMASYDLPIWVHPWIERNQRENVFTFDQETADAMLQIVMAGIFHDYPDIKIITHHCGGIVPLFDGRMKWALPLIPKEGRVIDPVEHFRKFYVDSAVSGSTAALMCGYDFFGIDKMLFATDAPLGPSYGLTRDTILSVERMNISDAEKERIFEHNAVKLLRLRI